MDPDVVGPDVDAVETARVPTAHYHVVEFAVLAGIEDQVEERRVDQEEVVRGEVLHVPEAQEAGTGEVVFLVVLVAIALHCALASTGEHLEVRGVLYDNHVPFAGAGAIDGSIELQSPCFGIGEFHPCRHGKVAFGDDYYASGLAVVVCFEESVAHVRSTVGSGAVVGNVTFPDYTLVCDGSERSDFTGEFNGAQASDQRWYSSQCCEE